MTAGNVVESFKSVKLANPRGFCAGVDRAIDIVNRALDQFGKPIYVRHEVVHNRFVVNDLCNRGAIFVEELHEVPDDNIVIFSAHGVSKAVQQEAGRRDLKVFDATCPLVTKVHFEVIRYSQEGYDCILIGHHGHPEVEGTMGQFDTSFGGRTHLVENEDDVANLNVQDESKVAFVTQTTLSVDDTRMIIECLRQRFPTIKGPRREDICYATQNRQDAVRQLALETQVVLVVGSQNSSNSNRLKELAERCGCEARLIDNASDIDADWIKQFSHVGLTAGASAPESIVQDIIDFLRELGHKNVTELSGKTENINFSLPRELR